jgi:hypothetical protein
LPSLRMNTLMYLGWLYAFDLIEKLLDQYAIHHVPFSIRVFADSHQCTPLFFTKWLSASKRK